MVNPDILTGRLGNRMFQTAFLYAQVRKGLIPDWYVQDCRHFEDFEDEIKELFGKGIGYLTQVGVHVRRGDYVGNPFYVDLCETDYYERAMALFPNAKFVIFSDDPAYCRERFKGDNIQVMEKGDEVDDLNLLASCEHLIIANSSFSWWAAYLCPNGAKRIIAPKQWYRDGLDRTVCPKEWTRI